MGFSVLLAGERLRSMRLYSTVGLYCVVGQAWGGSSWGGRAGLGTWHRTVMTCNTCPPYADLNLNPKIPLGTM